MLMEAIMLDATAGVVVLVLRRAVGIQLSKWCD
jgi:hypothetical protein